MKFLSRNKLCIVMVVYLIVTIFFSKYDISIYQKVINPIFWILVGIICLLTLKKNYYLISRNRKYIINLVIILLMYSILCYLFGLKSGYVLSPYKHSLKYILTNVVIEILPICSMEILRKTILIRKNKWNGVAVFVTLILFLLEINYNQFYSNLVEDKYEVFKYVCSIIIPLIINSFLYSYFALRNSYLLPITIRLYESCILFFMPIYPDLDWFERAMLYILFDCILYYLFEYVLFKNVEINRKKEKRKWKISIIFYMVLIGFMIGIFYYRPITILSNSMSPIFHRGDVVIYRKVNKDNIENINENDIIIFENSNQTIVHRVNSIINNNGTIYFQTKGDSNNTPDSNLVSENEVKGVYIMHIKYVGFPSVWLYEFLKN